MRLWSYQSPVFSLLEGEVKTEKSIFAQLYPTAYQQLWNYVGTDQFIWCCVSPEVWSGRCEWELEVPENCFFRIIDCMVWAGILGNNCDPPPLLRNHLKQMSLNHTNPEAWYEDQVKRMLHPPGCPWDAIFLNNANDLKTDVLLKHPIDSKWIILKNLIP